MDGRSESAARDELIASAAPPYPSRVSTARPTTATDRAPATVTRRLPVYAAGAIDVPFVISGMLESITRDTVWAEHSHPTHELVWTTRGASSVSVGAKRWTIAPAVGLWIPAGVLHSGLTPAGTLHYAAQFSIATVPAIADVPVAVDVDPLLSMLLERLCSDDLTASSRAVTEAMVLDVLAPSPHEIALSLPTSPLLQPIVDRLEADPSDTTTLTTWAARLGVSSRTLARAFATETGLGFTRWVSTLRVQRAIPLLCRGERIEDVAWCVGFHSQSAFGSAFRRVTGMSPGQYRSQ